MKPYSFHEEALRDLAEALAYYREQSPELAERFYYEIEGLLNDIRTAPHRYRIIANPIRRHLGSTFPYALLYVDRVDGVFVLAVSHFKRRPDYWRDRLA